MGNCNKTQSSKKEKTSPSKVDHEYPVAPEAKRSKTLALLNNCDGEDFKKLCILELLSNPQLDSNIFASILNRPVPSDAQIRKLSSTYRLSFALAKIIEELNATLWKEEPLSIPTNI